MTAEHEPAATVLITTRDRRERLIAAIRSAAAQTADVEIIVLDDASRDGTAEMVHTEFPKVRVVRSEAALGCPAQRNRGFAIARGAVVVCLDDDAYFSTPETVAQVLAEFDDPRIAVVTIPYVNVRREHHLRQLSPDAGRWVTGTFAGGASALRRDAFRAVGGYAELGGHGEETDLAVRLLERGEIVRLGRADQIVHDEADLPKPALAHHRSSRNHLLGVWRNVPWPYLPGQLVAIAAKTIVLGLRSQQAGAVLRGVAEAARDCASGRQERVPVRWDTHLLMRRLIRRSPLPIEAVLPLLNARRHEGSPVGERQDAPLHIVSVMTTHAAGGAEFAAVDMLAVLARRGASVHLLTNRLALVEGTPVEAIEIDLGPKLRRRTLLGVALAAPLNVLRLVAALRIEARARPIDVLLVHYKKEQLLAALLPRTLARAVVWAEWGPLPSQLRSGFPRAAYGLAARSAKLLIAESPATARSVIEAGVPAAKVVVVANVLEAGELAFDAVARLEYRRRWGLDQSFVLGCISRLDPAKRVDVAIDALADCDDSVALVIAGEGEHEAALRARAARFGARVLFIGGARGRVAQILSACDLQVYTPGPSEGAARAVTFGQLVGRPVIATAPEGARELVVSGTGTIVDPANDAAALAEVIEAYRGDGERIAEEGAAGRRHALRRIESADSARTLESALWAAGRHRQPPIR